MSESSQQAPKKTGTAQRRKARKLILQALYQWQISGSSIAQVEAEFRADNDFDRIDAEYFKSVFREIPKMVTEIDREIEPFLDRAISDVDPIEMNLLRMGVFEFKHRIDVPYRVVINEAVELAKVFGGTDGHKYINGILDKLSLRLRAAETRNKRV
ncbi:MAG: N utilization substance protein B [Oleiphilaceae bacterium]